MLRLNLDPIQFTQIFTIFMVMHESSACEVIPGTVFGVNIGDKDNDSQGTLICQPISFPPNLEKGEPTISRCSICDEAIWRDIKVPSEIVSVCWNCAIVKMAEGLSIEIKEREACTIVSADEFTAIIPSGEQHDI